MILASVACSLLAGCGASEIDATERAFSNGREAVTAGRYSEGRKRLINYLEENAEGRYASRAQFFIAKLFLGEGNLVEAHHAFSLTMDRFPTSLEARKSRYKLAMIALIQGDRRLATSHFAAVANADANALRPEAEAMGRWLRESGDHDAR